MLFNIYFDNLPDTLSKIYGYADDLGILLSNKNWETIETRLKADINILLNYLTNLHLKLSVAKIMPSSLHLNNREASHKLNIMVDNNRLHFQATMMYLWVRLDHMLRFCQHLENLSAKTSTSLFLIRRLSDTTWGALTRTQRSSTQALVFLASEYYSPV